MEAQKQTSESITSQGAHDCSIKIYSINSFGIEEHEIDEVKQLLDRDDGFLWIDIRECNSEASSLLADAFQFHPLAIQACREPTHLPKVHAYTDYLFIALQIPELGSVALITVLLLPVTAIASIYGMNIIVNQETQPLHLIAVIVMILMLMTFVFRWAKRQGWW